jgi:hypothetical protein
MIQGRDVMFVTVALKFVERTSLARARIEFLQSETHMSKVEFKAILLPYKTGQFQEVTTDLTDPLNKEGEQGWTLSQIVLPSTVWGRANTMIAIMQRTVAA